MLYRLQLSLFCVTLFLCGSNMVSAQGPGVSEARRFVSLLNNIILFPLIALMTSVAFLVFLYGCGEYIAGANNPAAREKGVTHITYGIIGLVVMISAWAILNIAAGTFGLTVPT